MGEQVAGSVRRGLIVLAFASLAIPASSETLILEPGFRHATILKKEILDDKSRSLGVSDILAPGADLPFMVTSQVNFGFRDNPFWLRVNLENHSGTERFAIILDQPIYDKLDVYLVEEGNAITASFHQDYLDPSAFPQAGRVPVFKFRLGTDRRLTLLVRVQNKANVKFPLVIRSEESYAEWMADTGFFYGMLLGFLVVILFYNLFLFLSIRDRAYGLYVLYLFCNLLVSLYFSGMAYPIFFRHSNWGYFKSFQPILGSAYFLLTLTSVLFTQEFLMLEAGPARRILRAYIAFAGVMAATFLAGLTTQEAYYTVLNTTNIFLIAFLIALGAAKANKGFRPARYYLIAWAFNGLGMMVTLLEVFGLLPTNLLTYNGSLIGAAFEVVFLSFALGDRINAARSEKEIAQAGLIEEQRSSLAQQTAQAISFARFVPADFLRFLGRSSISEVQLGDHVQRDMTVLFSDIRAFTTLSEAMTPRESFEFVNAYLGRVGPVIQRHGGFIDKYIGDAIMALFPERPSDAVGCAVDMMRELRAFNQDRDLRGEGRIAIGIGAHCGELILGTVGEAGRMDTTVISDVVNTASRLEGLTKLYGCGAIVSDEVLGDLDRKSESAVNDPPASRRLDLVRVKGRTAAVLIHELLAGHDESRQKTLLSTKPRFESAGELYRRGEIAEALKLFEEILAIDSLDYASKLFRERCLELLGSGIPPGWDGAYSFDMK